MKTCAQALSGTKIICAVLAQPAPAPYCDCIADYYKSPSNKCVSVSQCKKLVDPAKKGGTDFK